ncbi:hypothetical protein EUTSA_v10017528mg [Eutrema salsugineum]|uniref:Knottin scorpion toxin-like domain-containing protein n=1 Tax=Eutrema salsugineum TaxID=72664 RepID=V4M8W5_EUTSA|nr:defensin-like protein 269 [Eutrema salsugineum]ESQ51482.1 hypothetical protein EUTSA_v10017528mg [Eutrema salsugineum]
MASSKTTLMILLVALLLSCVWISNAREMMKHPRDVECVGACPPTTMHQYQYFGSCFKDDDCRNSCFQSCKFLKCSNHECDCQQC